MNKYISLIILIAVFIMAGCKEEDEQRYVCTSFSTPWSYSAIRDDGMLWWGAKHSGKVTYKIPDGDICYKENRKIRD